jgi:uncharacterized protein YodC (DUF2158 family)
MANEQQNFPDGSQVQLKSGGPIMTVENYGKYREEMKYLCKWYDSKINDYKSDTFKEAMLKRVD